MKKTEIMKDLKFCQELMDRLIELAEENYRGQDSYFEFNNHTVIQNDVIRLRRELNEVRKKLERWE